MKSKLEIRGFKEIKKNEAIRVNGGNNVVHNRRKGPSSIAKGWAPVGGTMFVRRMQVN